VYADADIPTAQADRIERRLIERNDGLRMSGAGYQNKGCDYEFHS